jgi:hypothetical protein
MMNRKSSLCFCAYLRGTLLAMNSEELKMKSNPWWWFDAGTEVCSVCEQSYAYQTGAYCIDCDCNVCPLCVQESENHDPLCSACCGQ